uniref:Uncharacterized protein n=1 Tax=Anguilla anguilla TaxID=7936 RepID=A0A0E9V5Y1_ANGAN
MSSRLLFPPHKMARIHECLL